MENIKNYQTELENTIIEMKSIIKGINSRPGGTEKCIHDLDIIMENTQFEQEKKKLKNKNSVRNLWDNIKSTNSQV